MTPPTRALLVFLVVSGLIVVFFSWVAASTRSARDLDTQSAYRLRRRFFVVLTLFLLVMLILTMPHMPYPDDEQKPDRIVFAVGKQFSFGISDRPISTDEEWEAATSATPVSIPAGTLVEFRITSFDTNHGFSIYSPSAELLGQTQAMPAYVNRLRMRLVQPGTYRVLCMELCGMGHHRMRGVFNVRPAQQVSAAGHMAANDSF
jgi:cytochrome c oxidase subunit II